MAFKLDGGAGLSVDSPESLFRDIKAKKIPGPLADQADLWRAYQEQALDVPDVALQLPIGGGKTLVGLVLSEWRRQKFGDRVVYLCPTRQLVNQVVTQATALYGLKVNGFTGAKANYRREAVAEYLNGERLAVTTYSSLFNPYPFFDNPTVIVLDDAHAAEQYIAGMWTIVIDQTEDLHRPLYQAILAVLKPVITGTNFERIASPDAAMRDRSWVEKLPSPTLALVHDELVRVIDANATEAEHRFPWGVIRDHFHACHLYFGGGSILIRPLLPPTDTHAPFANAKQRIYMSATFGAAGELERVTGRRKIQRIQAKGAGDRQTIGRRYFLFPERTLMEDEQLDLCGRLIGKAGRALVLTPDGRRERKFREFVESKLRTRAFSAQDIEQSKAAFVAQPSAVAVVANRYDGIDFPKDECRLLIVEGLPRAMNLQEQFLITRIGAIDLLNVRIATRLTQAFGRCTRSDDDYSAVVVRGEELNKHLMTPERRELLHPELHAEIAFGIKQAQGSSVANYLENFELFLGQGDDWRAANAAIVGMRNAVRMAAPPGAADLEAAAPLEIGYQLAMWHADYQTAFDSARAVLAKLLDAKLRGYRALWHYLAGSAAWLAFKGGAAGFDARAREQFALAQKAERSLAWLVPLTRLVGGQEDGGVVLADKATWGIVERIEVLLDRLGTITDYKYEQFEAEIRRGLEQDDASAFERAHAQLGELLGYQSGNRNDTGSPDPWWLANEHLCFIFEDHSDAKETSSLHVDKARQACTHPNWVRDNLPVAKDGRIVAILVSPVSRADQAALPHLKDVLYWNLNEFREWARNAMAVMREIRRDYPGSGDLVWRAAAAEKLTRGGITPNALLESLRSRIASDVLNARK